LRIEICFLLLSLIKKKNIFSRNLIGGVAIANECKNWRVEMEIKKYDSTTVKTQSRVHESYK
jgi:hypothetical protein